MTALILPTLNLSAITSEIHQVKVLYVCVFALITELASHIFVALSMFRSSVVSPGVAYYFVNSTIFGKMYFT